MLRTSRVFKRAASNYVKIVEVGPRDGLQNEITLVPAEIKLQLIDRLVDAGLRNIEATAFVHPKWVPQMADQKQVMQGVADTYTSAERKSLPGLTFSALTPNLKGYQTAVDCGVDEVAVFGAASEAFSKKNINCTIDESLERFRPVVEQAKADGIKVRGYVSCIAGCPYQGDVPVSDVTRVCQKLQEMGCYEISLGDTIGVGTPGRIEEVIKDLYANNIQSETIALHCHDTYGQAIANCLTGLSLGIRTFDGAVAGLGGCPYAKGASGNVSTEDLCYMLHGSGMTTGVNLPLLCAAGQFISDEIQRENGSRVARATQHKCD